MNTPPGPDSQMSEALRNMAAHRAASHAVDRRGWTSQQWADDAKRLMSDLDGSVSSLLNGHVLGLIAERDAAVARAEAAEQAVQAHIDAAREQMAAKIAQALAAVPDEIYPEDVFGGPLSADACELINELLRDEGLGSLDRISAQNMRHAYRQAARIARQLGKGDKGWTTGSP